MIKSKFLNHLILIAVSCANRQMFAVRNLHDDVKGEEVLEAKGGEM